VDSGRLTWLSCLVLAVFVTFGGQTWALDVSGASESDATMLDDCFVAPCGNVAVEPARPAASPTRMEFVSPSDRLTVSDLFRPPERAA
jgi:hypothetical protein